MFVLLLFLLLLGPGVVVSATTTTTGSLEEVLEHGPLFDELQDEAWWNGVEVVDSISSSSASSLLLTTPEFDVIMLMDSSSSEQQDNVCGQMGGLWACGNGLRLPPPPPPVPPQLTDLIRQLQQHHQAIGNGKEEDESCLLCDWARLNATLVDLIQPNSGECLLLLLLRCLLIECHDFS